MIDNLPTLAQKVSVRLREMAAGHEKSFETLRDDPSASYKASDILGGTVSLTSAILGGAAGVASGNATAAFTATGFGLLAGMGLAFTYGDSAARYTGMAFNKAAAMINDKIAYEIEKKFPLPVSVEPA